MDLVGSRCSSADAWQSSILQLVASRRLLCRQATIWQILAERTPLQIRSRRNTRLQDETQLRETHRDIRKPMLVLVLV
jgi:hypothetical protein